MSRDYDCLAITVVIAAVMAASSVDAAFCLIPGYSFFSGKDSSGTNLGSPDKNAFQALAAMCFSRPGCLGFNTNGQLKSGMKYEEWPGSNAWEGLYVKNNGSSEPNSFACIIPGYTLYRALISPTGDLRTQPNAPPGELADLCDSSTNGSSCVGFYTSGTLKTDLQWQPPLDTHTDPADYERKGVGAYVKGLDLPGYKFYPGKNTQDDGPEYFISVLRDLKPLQLAEKCSVDPSCLQFNTNGALKKNKLPPTDLWRKSYGKDPKYWEGTYRKLTTEISKYTFQYNKFLSNEEKRLPGVDTTGLGLLPEQLAELCLRNGDCVAFDTTGAMKASAAKLTSGGGNNSTLFWQGTYIKKGLPSPPPPPPPPPQIISAINAQIEAQKNAAFGMAALVASAANKTSYEEDQQVDGSNSYSQNHSGSSYEDQQGDDSTSYSPHHSSSSYEDQMGDGGSSFYEDQQEDGSSSSYEDQQGDDSTSYSPHHSSSSYENQQEDGSSSSYEDQQGNDSNSYSPHHSSSPYEDQQGYGDSSFYEDQQGDGTRSYSQNHSGSSYEDQQGDGSNSYTHHHSSSSYEDQQVDGGSSFYEDQQVDGSSSYTHHHSGSSYEDQQGEGYSPQQRRYNDGLGGDGDKSAPQQQYYQMDEGSQDGYLPRQESYMGDDDEDDDRRRRRLQWADRHRKLKL